MPAILFDPHPYTTTSSPCDNCANFVNKNDRRDDACDSVDTLIMLTSAICKRQMEIEKSDRPDAMIRYAELEWVKDNILTLVHDMRDDLAPDQSLWWRLKKLVKEEFKLG